LAEVDIRSVREGTVSAWNALISNRHLAKLAEIAEAAREDLGPEVAVLDETPIIDPPRREMSNAVFAKTPEFVSHVVDTFRQHAASRRSTLIFCINRAMVQAITKAFVEQGIKTKAVDGHTRPHKRSTITADFNAGKFPVLVNCQVFTEGADIPSVSPGQGTIDSNTDEL
jgi:superfamily II DNA or RNA helicase